MSYLSELDAQIDRARRREEREGEIVEALISHWRCCGYAFEKEEVLKDRAIKFVRGEEA